MIEPTNRVTTPKEAIRAKALVRRRLAYADKIAPRDPVGAHWERREAAGLDAAADLALDPENYISPREPLQVGVGGEMVVATTDNMRNRPWLVETVRDSPDMVNASASVRRCDLAAEADVLEMALDAAETIQAANSLEKMLAHQMAALHVLTMRNAEAAGRFAQRAADPNNIHGAQARQIANVEAGRSTNAAARASEAFAKAILALEKIRNGGRQTVVVQHVAVADGGRALVAGTVTPGATRGGEDAS